MFRCDFGLGFLSAKELWYLRVRVPEPVREAERKETWKLPKNWEGWWGGAAKREMGAGGEREGVSEIAERAGILSS